MEDARVCIILLNYNGKEDTIECLQSIKKLSYNNFQTIIVDNSDGYSDFNSIKDYLKGNFKGNFKSSFPNLVSVDFSETNFSSLTENSILDKSNELLESDFVLIKANENKGFAAGNNIGIKYALKLGFDYVWLLNNDTVIDNKALTELVEFASIDIRYGIVGSKLVYYDNPDTIQALGGSLNKFFGYTNHIKEGAKVSEKFNDIEIDYVVGASMLISNGFINDIGLLDEDFFLYYEELDLAIRGKHKNYKFNTCINSVVYHKEGSSIGSSYDANQRSEFSEIINFKSRKKLYKKHFSLGLGFYIHSLFMLINRLRRKQFSLFRKMVKVLVS